MCSEFPYEFIIQGKEMGKVIKIILITFLPIVAIIFLIGAYYLATYEVPAPVDTSAIVKEKALTYLKERYSEEFEITNFINPEPYHNFYNITALRKGDPNDIEHEVTLHGWVTEGEEKEDDKITFYDNYAAIKVIPELKEQISELVLEDYPECKIHISFHKEWMQENINLYNSVDDFLKNDTYWKESMSISIFTLDDKFNEKKRMKKYCKKIFKQLADKGFQGSASLYFYNEKYYKEISDSIIRHYSWDTTFMSATCGEDFVYSRCDFKEDRKFDIDFRDK